MSHLLFAFLLTRQDLKPGNDSESWYSAGLLHLLRRVPPFVYIFEQECQRYTKKTPKQQCDDGIAYRVRAYGSLGYRRWLPYRGGNAVGTQAHLRDLL